MERQVTYEQLGKPTKPTLIDLPEVGTVFVTQRDLDEWKAIDFRGHAFIEFIGPRASGGSWRIGLIGP
jgi:hypothetical protein